MSHDEENQNEEREGIRDMIKRIVSVGVGAAFMTDESVKNLLNDLPLPKDIVNGLLQNARQAKADFLETLREEIKGQVGRIDPSKLVDDLVERYDIEVNAKVRFKRKENTTPPSEQFTQKEAQKEEQKETKKNGPKAKASRKTQKN